MSFRDFGKARKAHFRHNEKMHALLAYLNRLRRVRDESISQWEYDSEYRNFIGADGLRNWESYDRFTMGFARLRIPLLHSYRILPSDLKEPGTLKSLKMLCEAYFAWQYLCSQTLRHFPPRLFRQAEALHGVMSLHSERMGLSVFLLKLFSGIATPLKERKINVLLAEAWFQLPKNRMLRADVALLLLIQQCHVEAEIAEVLALCLKPDSDSLKPVVLWQKHVDLQLGFLHEQLQKALELGDVSAWSQEEYELPMLHFLEHLPEFGLLKEALFQLRDDALNKGREMVQECVSHPLIQVSLPQQNDSDQIMRSMSVEMSRRMKKTREELESVLPPSATENDDLIRKFSLEMKRRVYEEMTRPVFLKNQYETDIFQYYTEEMQRIQWHSSDVLELLEESPITSITDNDYQLLDVVKEIAFCEGFSYTIGYQNMMHLPDLHDFHLWNVNQCHEELKHYHAVRLLLSFSGLLTEHMDEDFLASTFEEPSMDAYCERYTVFMVNFLGETHNMRAYWLLAQAFDSPQIRKVLEWIFYDEVVHKKAFALHFKKLCKKEKDWELNSYENLMDHGLGIHQAMRCSRYRILMQKIGRYYAASGKTTALDFLNRSMKAQYLELKDLFSEDLFRLSEHEFRKKHLKAYLL